MNQQCQYIVLCPEGCHIVGKASCINRNPFPCNHAQNIILPFRSDIPLIGNRSLEKLQIITTKFISFFSKEAIMRHLNFDLYSRNPLISLIRDKIVLQLQLIMPGSVSMTLCRKCSISSLDEATACTCNLSLPVTR